jgi:hypothetical protein
MDLVIYLPLIFTCILYQNLRESFAKKDGDIKGDNIQKTITKTKTETETGTKKKKKKKKTKRNETGRFWLDAESMN